MSHRFYLDENVDAAIRDGLRQRGVDVLTAQEDLREGDADPLVFARAEELGRVLFTRDSDFLAEATSAARAGLPFPTVIYARQMVVSVRQCIDGLELFAKAATEAEGQNQTIHLPL